MKSVLAIMDSLGISAVGVGNSGRGVTTGCQAFSLEGYRTVPGKCCCCMKRRKEYW